MRIVIDVSPLSRPRTGVGNYLRGLLAGLVEAAGDEHEVVAFGPSGPRGRRRIRESLAGIPLELRLPLLPRAHAWRTAWSRLDWPPVERAVGQLDVFHFSDWMYPRQRGGVRATTVYDLVPFQHPEWAERATVRMHRTKSLHAARRCALSSPTQGSTRASDRTASRQNWAARTSSPSRRSSRARTCRP